MLYMCFGCMRGLLGTAAVKTHWKSVAALALVREPSAESGKKKKRGTKVHIHFLPSLLHEH